MQNIQDMQIEHVAIGELKPDPANPRRISDAEMDSLTRSLQQFGMPLPIIAKREDNVVVGGHQRLLAARRLGWKEVPVVYLDLTTEQARVLNLALNRISGAWDNQLLARLLSELNTLPDVDITLTGFSDDELKKHLKGLEAWEKKEKLEDFDLEEALEAARGAPVAHTGDLWLLGDHRFLCGDSLDPAQVERLVGGTRASTAFTDPPYNVAYGNHGGAPRTGRRRSIQNDDLGQGFYDFLLQACRNLLAFTDGAVYVCMSSSELHTLQRAFVDAGGHWSTFIIWAKDTFTLGRSDYQRQYEPILYGWREGVKHHWCGARDQGDVWQFDKPTASPLHPTTKPVPLVQRAIENSSQTGDVVLDLFLGSGSTLIGCERTGRVCYGVELEPEYIDVAVRRWESFTGEKAVREEQ